MNNANAKKHLDNKNINDCYVIYSPRNTPLLAYFKFSGGEKAAWNRLKQLTPILNRELYGLNTEEIKAKGFYIKKGKFVENNV